MRLYSTQESVEAGEVSLLAVLETIVAASIALFVGLRWDYTAHIAFGAIVAPFLMLRTDRSTRLGVDAFDRVVDSLSTAFQWTNQRKGLLSIISIPGIPAVAVIAAVAALMVRIGATVYGVVRWPLRSLTSLPKNWRRQVLAIDLAHPPEMVPGIQTHSRHLADPGEWRDLVSLQELSLIMAKYLRKAVEDQDPDHFSRAMIYATYFAGPLLLLGYVPALAYRWSFKATSIVYIPLIWVARTTLQKGLTLKAWLQQIKKNDEFEKVVRGWSAIVLPVLVLKGLYLLDWITLATVTEKIPVGKLTEIYLMPEAFPWWQYAALTNALLTFGLLYIASWALPRIEGENPLWKPRTVEGLVQGVTFTRGVFSLYSIGAVLYVFVVESFGLPWPALGTKILPFG